MSDSLEFIKRIFKGVSRPEIAQSDLENLLSIIDDVADLDREDWIEVFEDLKSDVEFEEARWRDTDE